MNYKLAYNKETGLFSVWYWSGHGYWRLTANGWTSKATAVDNLFFRLNAERTWKSSV